jgi:hypothetical protein
MKADQFGSPAEQWRWRMEWAPARQRTGATGGRCDTCIHSAAGKGRGLGLRCKLGGFATTPSAGCAEYSRKL